MTLEKQIEEALIAKLTGLKYTYRPDITDLKTLTGNFKANFERLNKVNLSDAEFERLQEQIIGGDVYAAAKHLREINTFERDDGTPLHYTLVNIKDWCKNNYEVINQLRINDRNSFQRYDVIILINGVPVVQIELKGLAISPRRAMQQIVEYKSAPGNGYTHTLLCFMQLFIVSNRTDTWYFANNNPRHFNFDADERFLPLYQWAAEDNKKITHLDAFAEKFLPKCTLGEMISRYMVLVACEQKLLMMRPYQIYAVKAIIDCIHQHRGNGYIWHTTGSGKTLTSFKASTLLKNNPDIDKCLFVVDRKDLDRQTREEFNKFQANCVEENTNTKTLVRRLLSDDYADKVIVTTIQKLGLALDVNSKDNYHEELRRLQDKRMVFIFDECHRSQFGDNHKAIKAFFPNAQLFGFTGTPIFEQNARLVQIAGDEASRKRTVDIFDKELHAYTITHAIEDRNVLRFHVDYYQGTDGIPVKPGDPQAKPAVVAAILDKHDAATAGRKFNALLATGSIDDAVEYHRLFAEMQRKRQAADETFVPLNVACVFSPPAEGDPDVRQIQEDLPNEKADNEVDPAGKKAALAKIIGDYNAQYGTNHTLGCFDLYYQDVQKRIKDQQYPNSDYAHNHKIDLMIVVDMLLTGFDSKYLNTLYVDKKLEYHNLIQAFSRTNRILNDSKPYGNILDFRMQTAAVDDAIALFSGEKVAEAREIWLVDAAPAMIGKLDAAVAALRQFMTSQGLPCQPEEVNNLKGNEARGQFINLFKEVQRIKTQLDQYTDLTAENTVQIDNIVEPDDLRAFRGVYLETAQRLKAEQGKPRPEGGKPDESAADELDFEFVLFASAMIDYDYIMNLIANYTRQLPGRQPVTRDELVGLIDADAKFIDERDDIREYIDTLRGNEKLTDQQARRGYEAFKAAKSARELARLAARYDLAPAALQSFTDLVLQRLILDTEALSDLFAPQQLGWKARSKKESELMRELGPLLRKLAQGHEISGLSAYEN